MFVRLYNIKYKKRGTGMKEKDVTVNKNNEEEEDDDYCDLDKNKICDNCGKCIETDKNYKIIKITRIIR